MMHALEQIVKNRLKAKFARNTKADSFHHRVGRFKNTDPGLVPEIYFEKSATPRHSSDLTDKQRITRYGIIAPLRDQIQSIDAISILPNESRQGELDLER